MKAFAISAAISIVTVVLILALLEIVRRRAGFDPVAKLARLFDAAPAAAAAPNAAPTPPNAAS